LFDRKIKAELDLNRLMVKRSEAGDGIILYLGNKKKIVNFLFFH